MKQGNTSLRISTDADTEAKVPLRALRPRWSGAIFVCGKCLKRHDDPKTFRQTLKAEVKARTTRGSKKHKTRIVKTACLGLCPKGAVILASAATLSAGDVLMVRDAHGLAEAADRLLPESVSIADRER